jgi:hypothetical protein
MSPRRVPPPFPQPFASTGTANPAQNAAGTPEGSAYPPDHGPGPRSTPNLMAPPNIPSGNPSAHNPAYKPIQDSDRTHPAFPMPQVQDPRVPTTPSGLPPPMMQRNDTTHFPGHLNNTVVNNTQVAPGPYAGYSSQAPSMSHSPLPRGSGILGATHFAPLVQKNRACHLQPNIFVF